MPHVPFKLWFKSALISIAVLAPAGFAQSPIVPLKIDGQHYVDPAGKPVRFWGMNLVALYPDHKTSDAIAANLAGRQINLVRPHHNLRPSKDWNPQMVSGSLVTYQGTSREFDTDALDKFDYLNAQLAKHGIYLAFSVNWSRDYRPGDVDILQTDAADRDAWMGAIEELNGWDWKKSIDVKKMLPVVDERAARINEEFLRKLLAHKNPYTGNTYAADPQVISYEVLNEASTEYAIICGNRFPDYIQKQLEAKWQAFAKKAGLADAGDLYKPASGAHRDARGKFLRKLDADYFERIKAVLRESGSTAPVTLSNLWRGENNLQLHAERTDFIEGHIYGDPLITRAANDWVRDVARTAVLDKPFFIGELNQAEGQHNIEAQSRYRTMLPLSAAAYGNLHDWSGLIFFAWTHGGRDIGSDGWSTRSGRKSNLGRMVDDEMQLDHLRTAGIIFRNGLVDASKTPIVLRVDEPFISGDYEGLMRGKVTHIPGLQNVHGVRKTFTETPPTNQSTPWVTEQSPAMLTSDNGQIIKDIATKQLTIIAPKVEAFSGPIDGKSPSGLQHLKLESSKGFATVILVSDDGSPLKESKRLVISRTTLDAGYNDTTAAKLVVDGLQKGTWTFTITRPMKNASTTTLEVASDGSITLPTSEWHEAELTRE